MRMYGNLFRCRLIIIVDFKIPGQHVLSRGKLSLKIFAMCVSFPACKQPVAVSYVSALFTACIHYIMCKTST